MLAVSATGRAVCKVIFRDHDKVQVNQMSYLSDWAFRGLNELSDRGYVIRWRSRGHDSATRFTLTTSGKHIRAEDWDSGSQAVANVPALLAEPKIWLLVGTQYQVNEWAQKFMLTRADWRRIDDPNQLQGMSPMNTRLVIVGGADDRMYAMARARGYEV